MKTMVAILAGVLVTWGAIAQAATVNVEGGLIACIGAKTLDSVADDWDKPGCIFHCLETSDDALAYLNGIDGAAYAGFNLLVSDGKTLAWLSNRSDGPRILPPGIYGLSNALLDSPWHKVVRAKAALQQLISENKINASQLMRILNDRSKAPVSEVETDRLPFRAAHAISAPFIVLPDYGTRSSSVALCDNAGKWQLQERCFDANGDVVGDTSLKF